MKCYEALSDLTFKHAFAFVLAVTVEPNLRYFEPSRGNYALPLGLGALAPAVCHHHADILKQLVSETSTPVHLSTAKSSLPYKWPAGLLPSLAARSRQSAELTGHES